MSLYPWPSFGGFKFRKEEHAIWGTDPGWITSAGYSRDRALGSATDVITTLSIGSDDRSFEIYLTPERYAAFHSLINTTGLFTDWTRPVPVSRNAFLSEVTPIEDVISSDTRATNQRKIHCKISLVSA